MLYTEHFPDPANSMANSKCKKEIPEVGSPAHSHHMLPAAEGVVPVVEEGHMLHNLHIHHSLPAIKYATPNQISFIRIEKSPFSR